MARLQRICAVLLTALAGALLVASPAQAQYSPGFQFLKAVKDKDGDKVVELLQANSTTLVDAHDITTGETALHVVVARRDLTWLRYLIGQGANPNVENKQHVTPLVLATQNGWLEGVAELIKRGARVDITNSTGETPLIAAVHRHDVPMMRLLLQGGADPDRADNSGRTARDYAKLDGANSVLLSEIDKNAKNKSQREGAAVYGPA